MRRLDTHDILPITLIAFIGTIGASNTLGGTALRASIALPLAQLTIITADTYATFALDGHMIELPEPFGFPAHAQCVTDAECEGVGP